MHVATYIIALMSSMYTNFKHAILLSKFIILLVHIYACTYMHTIDLQPSANLRTIDPLALNIGDCFIRVY